MKKFLFVCSLLFATPAMSMNVEKEIKNIQDEISVLQRQVYNDNKAAPTNNNSSGAAYGQYDEDFRDLVGKVDSLEHKIKTLNDKIDLINKDIDVRISLIEGKQIKQEPAKPAEPKEKFVPSVATQAPKTVTGEGIKNDELKPLKSFDEKALYKEGKEALDKKDYATAEKNFARILEKFPKSELAGNAQYWLGETYYVNKDYAKAAVAFANGYKSYKESNKGADSLLKLGMSMLSLKKNAEACAAFGSMKKEFPKADKALLDKAQAEAKKLECK